MIRIQNFIHQRHQQHNSKYEPAAPEPNRDSEFPLAQLRSSSRARSVSVSPSSVSVRRQAALCSACSRTRLLPDRSVRSVCGYLDALSGLRLGADDFLTKDLSLAHLIARVNALFRRVEALRRPTEATQIIRRGSLMLDSEKMQVEWNGQVVLLSLTEFWIVYALARHPGHVKNRQQLMDAANVVLDDNTITSHIKRIRRKFQTIEPKFDGVQTVYGMGYRWVD